MTPLRSLLLVPLPLLVGACASAGGTLVPLGPEHPASAEAPEVPIADPSAMLRAGHVAPAEPPADPPAPAPAGAYVCPMHPAVTSASPGTCPECGMKLVPRDAEEPHREEHHHDG